jgi:hypothetical protein
MSMDGNHHRRDYRIVRMGSDMDIHNLLRKIHFDRDCLVKTTNYVLHQMNRRIRIRMNRCPGVNTVLRQPWRLRPDTKNSKSARIKKSISSFFPLLN